MYALANLAVTHVSIALLGGLVAARGRKAPPVTLDWYDGNRKPKADGMEPVTATFDLLPGSGCLLVARPRTRSARCARTPVFWTHWGHVRRRCC